jgi:O-antigen/teichoic acid export membrane protein
VVVLVLLFGGSARLETAVLALLGAEITFLILGVGWAGRYLSREPWEGGGGDLAGHLRFGLYFFGANLLLMAVWRGGEVTVLVLSAAREQVGFYNIANAIAMAFGALIGQLAGMVVPHIATLHVTGDGRRADAWLAYSLKYLTIGTFAFVLAVDAVGEMAVRVVLGADYLPVVTNLKVLAVGLLPLALVRTAVTQAMILKQPGRAVAVAGAGLTAFIAVAVALVPRLGALGASISVAGAVAAAGLVAYQQFALGDVLGAARFWRVVLSGIPPVVLAAAPGIPALAAGALALLLYATLLFGIRAVTGDEVRRLVRAVAVRA